MAYYSYMKSSIALANTALWYSAIALIVLVLFTSVKEGLTYSDEPVIVRGNRLLNRPCDEIYVVGEGETLHTISDKCGDLYIVEKNPHIHDPDDVFPGLVIKITPTRPRKSMK